jgi:hypothetical protein
MSRLGRIALAAIAIATTSAHAGLVLYYPFDGTRTLGSDSPVTVTYNDIVGGVPATASNNAHTGLGGAGPVTYSTNTLYASGQPGNAYEVASFTDAVHKGTGDGLTIAFWLRGNTLNKGRVLYGEGSTSESNSYFSLGTDTSTGNKFRLFFRDKDGGVILNQVSNSTIQNTADQWYNAANTWHHVVWTDSGGNAKLYIDGVQDTANFNYTVPAAAKLANFNTTTILGIRTLSGLAAYWGANGGAADDFAVWNVVLPPSSIAELYAGTKTPLNVAAAVEVLPQAQVTVRADTPPQVDVEWSDPTYKWTLQTSNDLAGWAHLDTAGYQRPQPGTFKFTENTRLAAFYRLHKVGTDRVFVIGDSISTPGAWPHPLAGLVGKHVFSQAIGGTTSPSMVKRARGVELAYPVSNPSTPGAIHMKWHRHFADRSDNNTYRSQWAYYAKQVSEPNAVEVYRNGNLLGLANKSLKNFTTNYASNPKTITCPGHGFAAGDRVTFISNDPNYPSDLSVVSSAADWNFTSPNLPSAIIERRVYFAANVTPDSFEIKEFPADGATLNIGSNATGTPSVECGWFYDVEHTGGPWNVTWKSRTKYDDLIWLLEVSANDIPMYPVADVTIPNNLLLLQQMTENDPRFLIVCPTSGSFVGREPGSFNWNNFYNGYMPWVKTNYPDNHIDTMAVFDATRTATEKGLLLNPEVPEKLWLAQAGTPGNPASWQVFRESTAGARETWIGPGYIPLHLRASFADDIHPNGTGNNLIANAVAAKIAAKGW